MIQDMIQHNQKQLTGHPLPEDDKEQGNNYGCLPMWMALLVLLVAPVALICAIQELRLAINNVADDDWN